MSAAAIGIFDSGVGGLSILSGIHRLLPAETLLYVADSAHAPYGPKGEDFIRARSEAIMHFFLARRVKAVVVACNTATAAAIAGLRERYPLPFIGVEPAVKPAAAQSRSGVVGVLATSGTIASDKFMHLRSRFNGSAEIITCPCHGLVELIENPAADPGGLGTLLRGFIGPLLDRGADTLVLGCTHYSLIRETIHAIAGDRVAIVDAGDAVARELQRRLAERELLAADSVRGQVSFYSSGELSLQRQLLERYWGEVPELGALEPA